MTPGFTVTPLWASDRLLLVQIGCNVCSRAWSAQPGSFQPPAPEKVALICPECGQKGTVPQPRQTGGA